MHIYRCLLQLHDVVFFATREMGRLYETEKYLHNFALTYALQLVQSPYYIAEQVPTYRDDLQSLNRRQIYVTPAKPVRCDFVIHTFKLASIWYHVEMEKPKKNIPGYGRAKELAPESTFLFYVFSPEPLTLPRWIRLGKWMGKASVLTEELRNIREKQGAFTANQPLNPLDVPIMPMRYDLITMPPVSLINYGRFDGRYYEAEHGDGSTIQLPVGMKYFA